MLWSGNSGECVWSISLGSSTGKMPLKQTKTTFAEKSDSCPNGDSACFTTKLDPAIARAMKAMMLIMLILPA